MKASYLVQRLCEPYGGALLGGLLKDNPFSFGGGLKNGGLSDEAMDLLRGIFSFDYMGSAEFEFGAVPKALQSIAKRAGSLRASTVTVKVSALKQPWGATHETKPTEDPTIYVLADADQEKEARRRVALWAVGKQPKDEYGHPMRQKERIGLDSALWPDARYPTRVRGWLELDNGWFFFTDERMAVATAELFGVAIATKAAS